MTDESPRPVREDENDNMLALGIAGVSVNARFRGKQRTCGRLVRAGLWHNRALTIQAHDLSRIRRLARESLLDPRDSFLMTGDGEESCDWAEP